jgi:6-phosphogluconolactonase
MIKVFKNTDEIGRFVGELLIRDVNVSAKYHYSVSLSGGSTPKSIFSFLAEKYTERIRWDKMKFFWGDERCVPPSDKESNYKMAAECLLGQVTVPAAQVFRIMGENNPALEAIRYSNLVGEHLPRHNGMPSFSLMLLGLGDDGHTASIFPDQLQLYNVRDLFSVAVHPVSKQIRITATGKVINHAKKIAFIVTGSSKASIVADILGKRAGFEAYPASLVRPVHGELLWLLDEGAASGLDASFFHNSQ